MRFEGHALRRDVVQGAPEPAAAYLLGVGQLERTGGGVARIRERGFLVLLTLPVQRVEGLVRHQDLPADLEFLGIISVQFVRDVADMPDVLGHVIALHAVPAGERGDQLAAAVGEADGGAVELELAAVAEILVQQLVGPLGEFLDLGNAVGVTEGEHGIAMVALDEAAENLGLRILAHGGVEV